MSIELGSPKYYQADCADDAERALLNTSTELETIKEYGLSPNMKVLGILSTIVTAAVMLGSIVVSYQNTTASKLSPTPPPLLKSAWSSKAEPFSVVDPTSIGILSIDRPYNSKPGPVLSNLIAINSTSNSPETPLPTNTWYQNLILGSSNNDPENKIFQIPYIIDAAGFIPGLRTHPCHLQANDRMVMMNFEPSNGMTLGARETFLEQHYVHKHSHGVPFTISKLAIELEWVSEEFRNTKSGSTIRSPIVRGSPYTTMKYFNATPRVFVERYMVGKIVIDNDPSKILECGTGLDTFSAQPMRVNSELKLHFDTSDMTWLIFLSEPMEFECSNNILQPDQGEFTPGVVTQRDVLHNSYFDLRATQPVAKGMVRLAMSNNCTVGQNPQHCDNHQPRNQSEYETLLRTHADIYPTSKADIQFTFPVESREEEELRLILDWKPARMSDVATDEVEGDGMKKSNEDDTWEGTNGAAAGQSIPPVELLMFALPHHQERVRATEGSSNAVKDFGCQPNLHGVACPIVGSTWSMVEHLHRTSFYATRPPRKEMQGAIQSALKDDIKFELPQNYRDGAGDTYFSGKMLAKLGRILVVADESGTVDRRSFQKALKRLQDGVAVWFSPKAGSPFLYDRAWGGMIMCGCDYKWENNVGFCANSYPNCPALSDAGQNFGAGFYNDHHYHYGYHIYAAAVAAKFDKAWGRKYYQHIMTLVRDIVNPSDDDKYFPTWRHKDWYLGFSWASGIVTTIQGKPYPNGRNQESASEAIAAYEAVALYGQAMAEVFADSTDVADQQLHQTSLRVYDMGRLLMATEIRSTRTYWHVQDPGTPNVRRVYPEIYAPKVIGMMWSMLAQLQTWFGNEVWKSYGIQLMPITPASELRDAGSWLAEMIPSFQESCVADKDCKDSGWEVLIYATQAAIGDWRAAWKGVSKLPEEAFLDAGGNGHSLSNSLWYIATRPPGGANSSEVLNAGGVGVDYTDRSMSATALPRGQPVQPITPPSNHPLLPPVKAREN